MATGSHGRHTAGRSNHLRTLHGNSPGPEQQRRHNGPDADQRRARNPDGVLGSGQPHVPTDYRVDWAKSDEDYQSWKVDDGTQIPCPTDITAATITGPRPRHRVQDPHARARYYRGEHEGKSWGGPWATATITVAGEPAEEPTPTPEPAEEEPVQQPPRDDPAPEDTTPAAGTIETLTATDDDAGQLVLSWTAPAAPNADPTDYHVNWAKSTEEYPADTAEAGNAHPTTTTHTLAGLEYDTDYNVRVRARYSNGDHAASPWNGPWTETTAQVKLPLPAAPTMGATAVSPDGDVLLTWFNFEENDSITGYQILRGPDADNMVVIEDDTGSSSTSYTDTAPACGPDPQLRREGTQRLGTEPSFEHAHGDGSRGRRGRRVDYGKA